MNPNKNKKGRKPKLFKIDTKLNFNQFLDIFIKNTEDLKKDNKILNSINDASKQSRK